MKQSLFLCTLGSLALLFLLHLFLLLLLPSSFLLLLYPGLAIPEQMLLALGTHRL